MADQRSAITVKPPSRKSEVGRLGEELAAQALVAGGLTVLGKNWRGHRGELDIVALDGGTLVAVEVKTRSSLYFGAPAAAITNDKIMRMKRLLCQWIAEHRNEIPRLKELRLDAVAVVLDYRKGGAPVIEHLKGIY